MAARPRTLDVKEPQILLDETDDPDGYPWHHRLLVLQIKGGRWVALDPELELGVEADEQVLVISDPRDEYFGVTVPQASVDDSDPMVEGGAMGVVEHE